MAVSGVGQCSLGRIRHFGGGGGISEATACVYPPPVLWQYCGTTIGAQSYVADEWVIYVDEIVGEAGWCGPDEEIILTTSRKEMDIEASRVGSTVKPKGGDTGCRVQYYCL